MFEVQPSRSFHLLHVQCSMQTGPAHTLTQVRATANATMRVKVQKVGLSQPNRFKRWFLEHKENLIHISPLDPESGQSERAHRSFKFWTGEG